MPRLNTRFTWVAESIYLVSLWSLDITSNCICIYPLGVMISNHIFISNFLLTRFRARWDLGLVSRSLILLRMDPMWFSPALMPEQPTPLFSIYNFISGHPLVFFRWNFWAQRRWWRPLQDSRDYCGQCQVPCRSLPRGLSMIIGWHTTYNINDALMVEIESFGSICDVDLI